MKHCHINLLCNELPFLKQKLPFLFNNFEQVIIIDYDILGKCNSNDGSLEFIDEFKKNNDPDNKIIIIKDFDPNKITEFKGVSVIEKRKMFAVLSKHIRDDIDLVWATDLDEFFNKELIVKAEQEFEKDKSLISVTNYHLVFVYNQYNIFNFGEMELAPRITRHQKGKIYGHCDFKTYGKTINITSEKLYHFAYVGIRRCTHKLTLYNNEHKDWIRMYREALNRKDRYLTINHPGLKHLKSIKYDEEYPEYINVDELINDLNKK